MSEHGAPSPVSRALSGPAPNPSFWAWIQHHPLLFVTQLLGLISIIASPLYYAFHISPPGTKLQATTAIHVNLLLHLPLLGFAAVFLIYHLDDNDEGAKRTSILWRKLFRTDFDPDQTGDGLKPELAVRNFKIFFLIFVLCMLLFYAWSLVDQAVPAHGAGASGSLAHRAVELFWMDFVGFLLNSLGGFALLLCFLQMYGPTRDCADPRKWNRWIWGYAVIFVAALCAAWMRLPSYVEAHQDRPIEKVVTDYKVICNSLSGAFNAVVMMLLISRLDSKLVGLSSGLVGVLYTYATVQTLFAVFPPERMEWIKAMTLYVVLGFKLYFFFIIQYALRQGRLLCYMICYPELRRRRNEAAQATMLPAARVPRAAAWLRIVLGLWISLIVGRAFALVVQHAVPRCGGDWNWSLTLDMVNLVVLGVALPCFGWLYFKATPDRDVIGSRFERIFSDEATPDEDHIRTSVRGFTLRFGGLLVSLFVFYLLSLQQQLASATTSAKASPEHANFSELVVSQLPALLTIAANNATGLFLFLCFLQLALPKTSDDRYAPKRRRSIRFAWVTFGVLLATPVLLMGSVAHTDGSQKEDLLQFMTVWKTVSGLCVGIASALLIARFDSTLMWSQRGGVRILYVYAAIQPLFVVFDQGDGIFPLLQVVALFVALVFKVWLMVVVWRLIRKGGLATYVHLFPRFDELAREVFRNGFLIRFVPDGHGHSSITVHNEGRLMFDGRSGEVSPCASHTRIDGLIKAAERRENYSLHQSNGTWTVQLVGQPDVEYLRGRIDFPNREKADDFVKEAVAKLPNCKVSFE